MDACLTIRPIWILRCSTLNWTLIQLSSLMLKQLVSDCKRSRAATGNGNKLIAMQLFGRAAVCFLFVTCTSCSGPQPLRTEQVRQTRQAVRPGQTRASKFGAGKTRIKQLNQGQVRLQNYALHVGNTLYPNNTPQLLFERRDK